MFPLMLGAGVAVDYSRMLSDQKTVQHELDLALLGASHQLNVKTNNEIRQIIKKQLKASLSPSLAKNIEQIKIKINKKNGKMEGFVSGYTMSSVTAIAGYDKLAFETASSIKLNIGAVEVALVLDNTYSMSADGKMNALKTSAKDFVNSLFDEAGTGELKVALVPFSRHVNVGVSNKNASWLKVDDDYVKEGCNMVKPVISKSGCVKKIAYTDGIPREYESCKNKTYGPPVEQCYSTEYKFRGCVASRISPFNLNDKKYNGNRKVPGVLMSSTWDCPNEIQTLTDNKPSLISQIKSMNAKGNTYIPAGVMWGWRTLSKAKPFSQGTKSNDNSTKKIMVLMTDGDNQASAQLPASPWHYGNDIDKANNLTKKSCENAKADGISIFTITFGETIAADTKALMVNCASSPDHYFDAANGSGLKDAFNGILDKLSNLYLSS